MHRNDEAGADKKDKKVVLKADVEDAESAQSKEFDALKAQVQALQAQLRGDTTGAKRGRNGVPVKKEIPVCTKCKKRMARRLVEAQDTVLRAYLAQKYGQMTVCGDEGSRCQTERSGASRIGGVRVSE